MCRLHAISLVSFPDHSPTPPLRRWDLGIRLRMSSLPVHIMISASQHCSSCSNADGAQGNNLIPSLCTGTRIQHLYFYTQKTQGTQCMHDIGYLIPNASLVIPLSHEELRSGETSPNVWARFRNLDDQWNCRAAFTPHDKYLAQVML